VSDRNAKVVPPRVRFARSATKHRISKESIRHVIGNYRVRFEEPPPAGSPAWSTTRIVYLGEDAQGHSLEVMAVEGIGGEHLVIHAMAQRERYRKRSEGAGQ
jgi:hypothetical protein